MEINKTINETELFQKYKSTYTSVFIDLSFHIFLMCSSFYSLWYFRNSWLSVFTVPLVSFMNCRTFVVFHDCGHNSYTPSKTLNHILGNILGVCVFTPFCWNWHHGNHHLTSGNTTNNLNHKYNELIFHNLQQYKQWNWLKQTIYKTIRHPIVFFSLVPFLYFGIKQRTDVLRYKLSKKHPFVQSTIQIAFETALSNAFIIGFVFGLINYGIFLHYCVCMFVFSFLLLFTFHNQHTYNPSYVITNGKWTQR
jgi:omega-6 fatty acid desaturase (delta-12 desaturase)